MWEQQSQQCLTGQTYEGYQVLQVLGSGTFGKVYRVRELATGRDWALKHVLQNRKYKNRELDIMRGINSDCVVRLQHYFYKEQKQGLFLNLVMECMPQPLSAVLRRNLPYNKFIEPGVVKEYARGLLGALRDMQVVDEIGRGQASAIATSSRRIFLSMESGPNFVTLAAPRSQVGDRRISPTFVRGTTAHLNCFSGRSSTAVRSMCGLRAAQQGRC